MKFRSIAPVAILWSVSLLCALASATSPLCPNADTFKDDDTHIHCNVETGSYAEGVPPEKDTITVLEYNIDRNGRGGDGFRENGMGPFISLLKNEAGVSVPPADIILLSEVGRCNGENGAEVLAKELKMHFAYGVEFIKTGGYRYPDHECSIGNAILSRYPLEDVQELRYSSQCCRYDGRYGGRQGTYARARVGPSRTVHIASVHLESGRDDVKSIAEAIVVRTSQGTESGEFVNGKVNADPSAQKLAIIGGDFNAPLPKDGPVTGLNLQGYTDAFATKYWWWQRNTHPGNPFGLRSLDYIMSKGHRSIGEVHICDEEQCKGWSDHVPTWASFSF